MTDSASTANPTGGADSRRGVMPPALHDDLMARVLDLENLRRAWKRVKTNRGAPGIDGMRIEDFAAFAGSNWAEIRQQLSDGRYLRAGVLVGESIQPTALGTPQGADWVRSCKTTSNICPVTRR